MSVREAADFLLATAPIPDRRPLPPGWREGLIAAIDTLADLLAATPDDETTKEDDR